MIPSRYMNKSVANLLIWSKKPPNITRPNKC